MLITHLFPQKRVVHAAIRREGGRVVDEFQNAWPKISQRGGVEDEEGDGGGGRGAELQEGLEGGKERGRAN